jgi:hypothetical protein
MNEIVAFSQRDPRWKGDPLGTSQLTLGKAGCLVTAAASLLASWGNAWNPQTLNVFLRQSHGYVDDCLFRFSAIDPLGARCTELINCYRTPAPIDRLAAAIAGGAGVLALVDWAPGGTVQSHWVWITELAALSGHIMDPWQMPTAELVALDRYLAPGWTPARGIFMAAVYARVDAVGRSGELVTWHPVTGQQPEICKRGGDGHGGD